MVKIEIAENAGFCFGVRRAVEIAEKAAEKHGKVFTLGGAFVTEEIQIGGDDSDTTINFAGVTGKWS